MSGNPLAGLFAALWAAFIDGTGIEAYDLEHLIEATGLAEWRDATKEDVQLSGMDIEVGDPIMVLTEAGKRLVREGSVKDT